MGAKVKLKTKKSIVKRFKLTANGKVKRNRPGASHLMQSKNAKRKRRLRSKATLDTAIEKKYRNIISRAC